MSVLPEFRFPADGPFSFRAAGLYVSGSFASKTANEYHKRYALIFTCPNTRAVHLKMGPDVSTAATIEALRRFFSLTVEPLYYSTNFVTADIDLQLIFKSSPLQEFLARKEIKWKFIPTHTPNFGGIWNSIIRSYKEALYSVIGSQTLTNDTFATALNEIKASLNNRPIADVHTDISDSDALTPNHVLLEKHTSMRHLDSSTTNKSLTSEFGSIPNKMQTMFGPASSTNTCQHFYLDKNGSKPQHL